MGSTGIHVEPGQSTDAILRAECGSEILASVTVHTSGDDRSTIWYAVERRPDGTVHGLVALVHRSRQCWNFTYKWVSEEPSGKRPRRFRSAPSPHRLGELAEVRTENDDARNNHP